MTLFKARQLPNAVPPIVCNPSGRMTSFNEIQSKKAP